jgi:hypothetical protein
MRRTGNRYRCDGCGQSWRKVRAGAMLTNDVWLGICDQDADVLCDQCIRVRIVQVYHRPLRFEDLKPCEFNMFSGYFEELAPPELLRRWLRWPNDGGLR